VLCFVLRIVDLTPKIREEIECHSTQFAVEGLRVLALAYIEEPSKDFAYNDMNDYENIESHMTFVGLTGLFSDVFDNCA